MKQCPDCNTTLQEVSGCGSVSYFCPHCKKLVSRSRLEKPSEKK